MKTAVAILSILLVIALIFGFSPLLRDMMVPNYPDARNYKFYSGQSGAYNYRVKEYEQAVQEYETVLTVARFISFGLIAWIFVILYQSKKEQDE